MPSSQYVDLVLDGVDRLVEEASLMSVSAWQLLARHAQHGRSKRFAVIVKVMIEYVHLDRGPLLLVATARLGEHARSHPLAGLRCLDDEQAAHVLEAMQAALIARAMRDLITDHEYQVLLEPMTRTAALS